MKQQLSKAITVRPSRRKCGECKKAPAEVFKKTGAAYCYKCEHLIREKLDELRAMVNKCRAGSRL